MAITESSPGRRGTPVVWSGLLIIAVLAWALVVERASGMPASGGMTVGGLADFLAMWTAMMAAMMLPSVAPAASMYLRIVRARSRGVSAAVRVAGLVGGYLAVWAGVGVVAFAVAWAGGRLSMGAPEVVSWTGAAALVIAGLYQFTPLKRWCLRHCRSPLGLLLHFGTYSGRLRDLRVGLYHGGYCVGCCWGLMLVLVTVGIMSMAWMLGLACVVFLEKTWRYGRQLGMAVGMALIVLAVLVPWHPGLVGVMGS
jgi:predicted metal-binding membrane protein